MNAAASRGLQVGLQVERAAVLDQERHPEQQYLLHLQAPRIARAARPGNFIHLRCDALLPMRRPMSIMRADPDGGRLQILYAVHGAGTELLARKQRGATLELLGPAGRPFKFAGYNERPLLIGGGVGIPPLIFLAEHLAHTRPRPHPLVLLGSERPFPIALCSATAPREQLPRAATAAAALLEQQGIRSALAGGGGQPGCHPGRVTELARHWLRNQAPGALAEVEIFACGPPAMLAATAALAREYDLPCEVSVEEYMACATGGCGACCLPVRDARGVISMQRACVEGPVFDARSLFPAPTAPPAGTGQPAEIRAPGGD